MNILLIFIEIAVHRPKAFGLPDFTGGIFTLDLFSLKEENHI